MRIKTKIARKRASGIPSRGKGPVVSALPFLFPFLGTVFLGLCLLCSCSGNSGTGEDIAAPPPTVRLQLRGSSWSLDTRASEESLPEGTSVGVYVTSPENPPATAYYTNLSYVSLAEGALSSSTPVDLSIGYSYALYAYAPYSQEASDPASIVFPGGTDVLCASKSAIVEVSETNRTGTLSFRHCVSQLSFEVEVAPGLPFDFTASTLQVSGFYKEGRLDVQTGLLTLPATASDTLSSTMAVDQGLPVLRIPATCFFPSSSVMELEVKIITGNGEYTGSLSRVFSPGVSYRYTVKVGGEDTPLGLTGGLTDWEQVDSGTAVIR